METLPVELASAMEVTLIFLVRLPVRETSCVILTIAGLKVSSTSAKPTGESVSAQTPKVFAGGSVQDANWKEKEA